MNQDYERKEKSAQIPWMELNLRKRYLILSLIPFLVLGILLEIWLVNRLSTFGEQIVKLEHASLQLKRDNQLLDNETALLSSLKTIEEKSSYLGLIPLRNVQYLQPSNMASK